MSQTSTTSTGAAVAMSDHAKTPPIRILIGPKEQEYFLHRSLLTEKSTYFNQILNFMTSSRDAVALPRAEPAIFDDLVDWLYHGAPQREPDLYGLVGLYMLAYDLGCAELQNWVIEELQAQLLVEGHDITFFRESLKQAPVSSTLWRFLVEKTAYIMSFSNSLRWQQMYNINSQTSEQLKADMRAFRKTDRPSVIPLKSHLVCGMSLDQELSPSDGEDWFVVEENSSEINQ